MIICLLVQVCISFRNIRVERAQFRAMKTGWAYWQDPRNVMQVLGICMTYLLSISFALLMFEKDYFKILAEFVPHLAAAMYYTLLLHTLILFFKSLFSNRATKYLFFTSTVTTKR